MKIVSIILIIVLIVLSSAFIMKIVNIINNDCLKEIAKDYCEDNDMAFNQIHLDKIFTCKENERTIDFKAYKFLEDEIEECKE